MNSHLYVNTNIIKENSKSSLRSSLVVINSLQHHHTVLNVALNESDTLKQQSREAELMCSPPLLLGPFKPTSNVYF